MPWPLNTPFQLAAMILGIYVLGRIVLTWAAMKGKVKIAYSLPIPFTEKCWEFTYDTNEQGDCIKDR